MKAILASGNLAIVVDGGKISVIGSDYMKVLQGKAV